MEQRVVVMIVMMIVNSPFVSILSRLTSKGKTS